MSSSPPVSNCSSCPGNEIQGVPCNTGGDILHIVFCSLVTLFGVPGNCLILRVYWSKPRKTSTNIFIMALAWADLFSCVLLVHAIITSCVFGIGESPAPLAILRYFLLCAVGVSVNTTSMIAFDRYDCVCRPNRRLLNHRRAIGTVLVGFVYTVTVTCLYFAVLVHPELDVIPLIMLLLQIIGYLVGAVMIVVCYGRVYRTIRHHVKVGIGAAREETTGQGHGGLVQTKTTSVNSKSSGTHVTLVTTVTSGTDAVEDIQLNGGVNLRDNEPGPSCLSSNSKLSGADAKSRKNGPSSVDVQAKPRPSFDPIAPLSGAKANLNAPPSVLQRKTTRMLLVTSVVFLLSWVPYWVYVASLLATLQGTYLSPVGAFVVEKSAYLVYLNNAVNPLIYGLANRRFRKDCKDVLHRIKLC